MTNEKRTYGTFLFAIWLGLGPSFKLWKTILAQFLKSETLKKLPYDVQAFDGL